MGRSGDRVGEKDEEETRHRNKGEETCGKVWKLSGAACEAEDKRMEGETRTRDEDEGRETSYEMRMRTRAQDKNKNESTG